MVASIVLGFLLAPSLVAKVAAVRGQKASHLILCAFGIAIYSVAFSLVAVNIAVQFLGGAPVDKALFCTSTIFGFAALLYAGLAFASRTKPRERSWHEHPRSSSPTERTKSVLHAETFLLTLARVEPQNLEAKVLRFLLPIHQRLLARPGQFLTFEWFIDGRPVHRSYSICSSPAQTGYIEIMPKRRPGGCVSQFLNGKARPGLMVKARGPYGHFYFDETKHKRLVLIAGGSGIAPIISILRYIRDLCIPASCTLIYCARSENDLIFNAELCASTEQTGGLRYVPVISKASLEWMGWKGRLRGEILQAEIEEPLESTYFLCGPKRFMELGRVLLEEMLVESSQILQESFGD
jgi:ferredoxin-NADP reductase